MKINSFKHFCQSVLLYKFSTVKQFVVKDVNFVIFHPYQTQNQFAISIICCTKVIVLIIEDFKSLLIILPGILQNVAISEILLYLGLD